MEVTESVEVSLPYALVRAVLLRGPHAWLPSVIEDSMGRLLTRLRVSRPVAITRVVEVRAGRLRDREGSTVMPLTWSAAHNAALFPVFEGRLEAIHESEHRTVLRLAGEYTPPAGPVGRAADAFLFPDLAPDSITDFLRDSARAIEREAAGAAQSSG